MRQEKSKRNTISQTIFQQSPISTQIFSPDGVTIMVNNAWEQMWQIDPRGVINHYNILKDKHWVDNNSMEYIKEAFRGKSVTIPKIQYVPQRATSHLKDLRYRWIESVIYPVKDEKGNILYVVLQQNDVTERIKISEELERNEKKYRSLIEKSSDVLAMVNRKRRVEYISPSVAHILGYTPEEMKQLRNPFKLIHPLESPRILKIYLSLLQKPGSEVREIFRLHHKDGRYIWIDAVATNYLKDSAINAVVINFRDITKQREFEEELKKSRDELEVILANISEGIIVQDAKGKVVYANDAAANIFGYGMKGDLINITPQKYEEDIAILDEKGAAFIPDNLPGRRVFMGEKNPSVSIRVTNKKTNDTRWLMIRSNGVYEDTIPVLVISIFSDITEQKILEERKNAFFSLVSHELKTPVTSIKLFIDVVESRLKNNTDEKVKKSLESLKTQVMKLNELVSDLLDVSRIDTGKLRFRQEKFYINKVIEDTIDSLAATTNIHQIIFDKELSQQVYGDAFRIYQVVTNLVSNAIKYSPQGGKVIIQVVKKKGNLVVSVKDYGIGIAKKDQEMIFQRLYQAADAEERTFPGLGIGLYISKEIITRHKGKIWVKSKKGKGSTFYFTLPLGDDEENKLT